MLQIITTVYHSLEYSHLQYAIISWGNCFKIIKRKLQVKQNRIIKTLCDKFGAKTRLKPLYQQLQVLNRELSMVRNYGTVEFWKKVRYQIMYGIFW